MQKFTFSLVLAALFTLNLSAQDHEFCGTDHEYHKLVEQHPELIQIAKDYEKTIQKKILENRAKGGDDQIYIVPVVFHVLHDYGTENISNEQIYDAINVMNRDNRKLNPDTINIIPEFKDIASKTNIEFRLANVAPDGSCTNGINRVPTILTNDGSNPIIKYGQWAPESYLNIWVVRNMKSGTAGFSQYPSAVNNVNTRGLDGIVVRYNYVGSIPPSSLNNQHTLTHEAGHWLNLQHVWGNTNDPGQACGDDEVSDTPVTKGYTYCPAVPANAAICNAGIIENYQNFMDYSYCSNMFTVGQVERMHAALASNMAHRNYLVSETNNINVGVAGEPTLCTPSVAFYLNKNSRWACTGEPITFHSLVTNGEAETYSWDFPTADNPTSNEANPVVTYSTSGWKTVTLTAGNASGTGTTTNEYAVYVFDNANSISGNQIVDNFPSVESTYGRWIKGYANTNELSYGVNWAWAPEGCLDPGSMKLNVFDNPTREHYKLASPKYNLEGKEGQFFSFKYAFATQGSPENIEGKLEVRVSTNCGITEPAYLTISDPSEICTAGNYSGIDFKPDNAGLWKTGVIQIDDNIAQNGVQFIFEVNTGFGENNFYIDNINIGSWLVSTEDEEVVNTLKLYPNPAQDMVQLDFTLNRPSAMEISIFDLTGKKLKSIETTRYAAGPNNLQMNTSDLPNGAYIVELRGDQINKSMKLLLNK